MKVMKFGGSSLADAASIRQVADIIYDEYQKSTDIIVVLSAMAGVTNMLFQAAELAAQGSNACEDNVEGIRNKYDAAMEELFHASPAPTQEIAEMFSQLMQLLHGVKLVKECSPTSLACISGYGEQLSSMLMSYYLRQQGVPGYYVDARDMIILSSETDAVDTVLTYSSIRTKIQEQTGVAVVTGYVASTDTGKATTLGRNGSDYTAALVGAAVQATDVEIWTDVDGFFSADPRLVSSAFVLPEVSIEEAMELANCGASVVHPQTLVPLMDTSITIRVRNTFHREARGTKIVQGKVEHPHAITGLASIDSVALINIEGNRMVGSKGIASRIFSALYHADVNIMMISQVSSEHSICVVCREEDCSHALAGMRRELEHDIRAERINHLTPVYNLEIIAIVGTNMRGQHGIAGKLFSVLGDEGINVLAIAQGSSEMNISFVIQSKDSDLALNAIHRTFFDNGGA